MGKEKEVFRGALKAISAQKQYRLNDDLTDAQVVIVHLRSEPDNCVKCFLINVKSKLVC